MRWLCRKLVSVNGSKRQSEGDSEKKIEYSPMNAPASKKKKNKLILVEERRHRKERVCDLGSVVYFCDSKFELL
eukprot:MONOS_16396.1-p1 / transcript=MONOS_16396.1 / gene=MONOS_16396 / organism=Monocercomonoides_exilis_PA203 / gene_product=unspecified product / transcript_product=unspecified product / location=Mono_scaffold01702:733-1507(+) / protein_length=74 / sequence_SO=supercontig / SO=protein_coding / is_pseudo=false